MSYEEQGEDYMDESPASENEYAEEMDYSDEDHAPSGDIDDPESEGESPQAIPYERFKQSRQQYRAVREERDALQQQFAELQGRFGAMEEYNNQIHMALQAQREQMEQPEEDPFADPLEARVNSLTDQISQLSESLQGKEQEMMVSREEAKIRRELQFAKKRFPNADELTILDGLARNPAARVMDLARHSEKINMRKYQRWASEQGFKPRAKRLVPGRTASIAKAEDIGDDLDKAESAAIQYLLAMQE